VLSCIPFGLCLDSDPLWQRPLYFGGSMPVRAGLGCVSSFSVVNLLVFVHRYRIIPRLLLLTCSQMDFYSLPPPAIDFSHVSPGDDHFRDLPLRWSLFPFFSDSGHTISFPIVYHFKACPHCLLGFGAFALVGPFCVRTCSRAAALENPLFPSVSVFPPPE